MDFVRLIDYFRHSAFDYLALDTAGQSVVLERPAPGPEASIAAPCVGFVAVPLGARDLPRAGNTVVRGQVLFILKRFKSSIEVIAAGDGRLTGVAVAPGQFVEYGTELARMAPADPQR